MFYFNQLQFKSDEDEQLFLQNLVSQCYWYNVNELFMSKDKYSYNFRYKNISYKNLTSKVLLFFLLEFKKNPNVVINREKIIIHEITPHARKLPLQDWMKVSSASYKIFSPQWIQYNRKLAKDCLTEVSYRNLLKVIHPKKYEKVDYVI